MQVRSEAMSISSAHGHVRRMLQLSEARLEVLLELVIVANGSQPAAGFGRGRMEAKGTYGEGTVASRCAGYARSGKVWRARTEMLDVQLATRRLCGVRRGVRIGQDDDDRTRQPDRA